MIFQWHKLRGQYQHYALIKHVGGGGGVNLFLGVIFSEEFVMAEYAFTCIFIINVNHIATLIRPNKHKYVFLVTCPKKLGRDFILSNLLFRYKSQYILY